MKNFEISLSRAKTKQNVTKNQKSHLIVPSRFSEFYFLLIKNKMTVKVKKVFIFWEFETLFSFDIIKIRKVGGRYPSEEPKAIFAEWTFESSLFTNRCCKKNAMFKIKKMGTVRFKKFHSIDFNTS